MLFIIGLVGPFGSGCSYVAQLISNQHNYEVISLSQILRNLYANTHEEKECDRESLQDFGDEIREKYSCSFLAAEAAKIIDGDTSKNYVIDSIRNPEEVLYLRRKYSDFYLFGVFSEYDRRWERVRKKYSDDERPFKRDDQRDSGEKIKHGQRVTDTFRASDVILLNNETIYPGNENYKVFCEKIKEKIEIIERKTMFLPTPMETYMAMAYAVSMRSSCLKRKVGAIIVDGQGNTFSSGYNEVAMTQKSCKTIYGECYRDKLKSDFRDGLRAIVTNECEQEAVFNAFKSNFKILDYCRALHAEENAILNVARVGASAALMTATLYTSTYPCNLCANKIAQVGIQEVVYFEPYPQEEAKKILMQRRVKQTPFEGITYNGYFRLMEVVDL